MLLRAFAEVLRQVPKARLLLAGDGPERLSLERLISDAGISANVSLLGHLPRAEVERYFASAWVQVVPSRFAEAFGLVAVDAMMRGGGGGERVGRSDGDCQKRADRLPGST